MPSRLVRTILALCLALTAAAAGAAPCDDRDPLRRAYFGDTHVHTGWSLDAYSRFGAIATPDGAYRFARGAPIALPPFDVNGASERRLQLERPLDFAAVTDHAENLEQVRICSSAARQDDRPFSCRLGDALSQVAGPALGAFARWTGWDSLHHCGADGGRCAQARLDVWRDTVASAARHTAPCEFTAFSAWEWSGGVGGAMLHRNVLFSSDAVPPLPIGRKEAPQVEDLWRALDQQCLDDKGCRVITIPHNSNMSRGGTFGRTLTDGSPLTAAVAQQRRRYERLAEIYQHKGSSECFFDPLASEDELCAFEFLPYSTTLDKYVKNIFPSRVEAPQNDGRYLREGLLEGLRQAQVLGTNPYVPGFIASTDTHIAAPGAVEERTYAGHHGAQDLSADGATVDRLEQGPGGLAVVYAEENTRAALFAGMQRREAYGTSGTRIGLRVFAGDDLPPDLCERSDLVAQGYALGVPMGGDLGARHSDGGAPAVVVAATRDAQGGAPLQRLQVVKGWLDDAGAAHERVIDVAGGDNGAGVDIATCTRTGEGAARICAHWRDPDFDPAQPAFYYARAVENPGCRWNTWACVDHGVDCASEVPESLAHCCDDDVPKTVQERAWSSPIWYTVPDDG